jgi:predicted nuclease of restriction endonuclease-like (RecB) superfamily
MDLWAEVVGTERVSRAFVQAVLAQITWYHNIALTEKLQTPEDRAWYARATVQHGWSRNILVHQIESALHERQGRAVTTFDRALPSPQSVWHSRSPKTPTSSTSWMLGTDSQERDLERGLLEHLRQFLLELGIGFALLAANTGFR